MKSSDAPRASSLVWLRPSVAALVGLTDETPNLEVLKSDPGLLLHILRYARPSADAESLLLESFILQPQLCTQAAFLWETDSRPAPIHFAAHQFGLATAHFASQLAERSQLCSPDAAWCVGLLTPLSWYLTDADPQPRLARRAAQHWKLPAWLGTAIAFPELPIDEVVPLGGHRGLLRVVRTAIAQARHLFPAYDSVEEQSDRELQAELKSIHLEYPLCDGRPGAVYADELLPRLLRSTAELRTRQNSTVVLELERQVDTLTRALGESRRRFDREIRDAKLASLAEFAAGAAHEINNPLAVIAGNVELLLDFDLDPEWQQRLQTITRQTKRIHEILYGTHQFARPCSPQPTPISARELLQNLEREMSVEASEMNVRLEIIAKRDAAIYADVQQLQTALQHIVRNGIKAAGDGGWVKVMISPSGGEGDNILLIVEDSGHGPAPEVIPHLFDPFFSGHSAGRGRGLGLSIAWRFLKANGGDVTYEPKPDHPSRFVVHIPADVTVEKNERKSA